MLIDSFENKEKILKKFLKNAEFEGWNQENLLKSLKDCKIDAKYADLIFENGCLDLAEFYIDYNNEKSEKELNQEKIRDKIRYSLYSRFEIEIENKMALQRLINFYSNPKNFTSIECGPKPMIHALKSCYKIADFIWYNIGDKSTDFNFYSKRIILSKIILRSLLVFLKDDDENLSKTKKFIDKEIEKVMKFEKFKVKTKEMTKNLVLDEKGRIKSPKDIIKNLPFFRLIKF